MHRFLLPKCPCLEERLRNKSDVEEEEMPGVSDVDFEKEERRGQGGQPSTATEDANHCASGIGDISMNTQDRLVLEDQYSRNIHLTCLESNKGSM